MFARFRQFNSKYIAKPLASAAKVTTSLGMVVSGVGSVYQFAAKWAIPSIAKTSYMVTAAAASVGANALAKIPFMYAPIQFPEKIPLHSKVGKALYAFMMSSIYTTSFFMSLSSYYANKSFFETVINLCKDPNSTEESIFDNVYVQYGVYGVLALSTLYNFIKNDKKFLENSAQLIASHLENKQFGSNKLALAKTMAIGVPYIISQFFFTAEWTKPTIMNTPLQKILPNAAYPVMNGIAIWASITTNLTSLPTVYAGFVGNKDQQQRHSGLANGLKIFTFVSGGIDSFTGMLVCYVATGEVLKSWFALETNQAASIIASTISGASAGINNFMFNVFPPAKQLASLVDKYRSEEERPVNDEETRGINYGTIGLNPGIHNL